MANEQNLIPAKPGEVRNPNGKPKGTKNWSTVVRELLEDPDFEMEMTSGGKKVKLKYPAKVIAQTMILKAASGDVQAAKWVRETGYGNKLIIDTTDINEKKEERYARFLDDGSDDLQNDDSLPEASSGD